MTQRFPVQQSFVPRKERIPDHITDISWELVADHERQAHKNHSQSLAELAARRGCSPCELLAIIEDRPWHKMDRHEAHRQLVELEKALEV